MLRTTRQYVEVLATGTGKLRTTRQYAEILSGFPPAYSTEFLTSDLSFGQSVVVGRQASVSASNTIAFSDQALGGKVYRQIVGNTIAFSQDAYRVHDASSSVAFNQSLVTQIVHREDLASAVALGQVLLVSAVHTVSLTSAFQTVTSIFDPINYNMVDVITGLDSFVTSSKIYGAPEGFRHAAQFQSHVQAVHIKASATGVSVGNAISFGHRLDKNKVGGIINTVQFGQSLKADSCKVITSSITFDSHVSAVLVRNISVSSAIGFLSWLSYYVPSLGVLNQYHAFVGSGASGPSTTLNGPMTGVTAPFQLLYPADGVVTDSVTLRAPDFGNKDRLSFNRISRESRGGSLIVYADPIWPKIQTLVLSFSSLHRYQAQALLAFLENYLGQEIGLIDWEQRFWKGIIVSPENPVTEDLRDSFSASFNFEGQMDPTRSPLVIPVAVGPTGTPQLPPAFSQYCPSPVAPYTIASNILSSTADVSMLTGQVIYVSGISRIALALADAMPEAGAAGVLIADVAAGSPAQYVLNGLIVLADWTHVTGSQFLTPGAIYWLDSVRAGFLTSIAPSSGYIVPIGRALSQTQLNVEIQESVKL